MKTLNTIAKLLSVSPLLILQGCWGGYLGGGGSGNGDFASADHSPYSTKTTTTVDTKDLFEGHQYGCDKSFKMRDGITNAPLMSQKGQVNLTVDYLHGFGTSVSAAISKSIYVQAGVNFLRSSCTSKGKTILHVENINYYNGQVTDTHRYENPANYNLNMNLKNNSFFAAIGQYKTFGKYGRFEYCAGLAYGNASNENSYDLSADYDNSFKESRKYFQYFLQSDFGYVTNKTEGALILKASSINFTGRNLEMSYPVGCYEMKNNQLVLQPALKFGFGKTVRFYTQCGMNIPLGDSQLKWFSTNVQAGILFRINDKIKIK